MLEAVPLLERLSPPLPDAVVLSCAVPLPTLLVSDIVALRAPLAVSLDVPDAQLLTAGERVAQPVKGGLTDARGDAVAFPEALRVAALLALRDAAPDCEALRDAEGQGEAEWEGSWE